MTSFSGIRAVAIVLIIFIGAYGLLSLKGALSNPVKQKQQYLTKLIISLVAIVVLVLILIFL